MRVPLFYRSSLAVLVSGIVACAEETWLPSPSSDGACVPGAVALSIEPLDAQVEAGTTKGVEIQYRAIATYPDGTSHSIQPRWLTDLPDTVALTEEGVATTTEVRGGIVRITAHASGASAEARLAVRLHREWTGDVPADVRALFSEDRPRDTATAPPRPIAPPDGAELPFDPDAIRFEWDGAGHDHYRLLFESPAVRIALYTDATEAALPRDVWDWLGGSNRGLEVRWSVEAVDAVADRVHRSQPFRIARLCYPDDLCNGSDDDCDGSADEDCVVPPAEEGPTDECH